MKLTGRPVVLAGYDVYKPDYDVLLHKVPLLTCTMPS